MQRALSLDGEEGLRAQVDTVFGELQTCGSDPHNGGVARRVRRAHQELDRAVIAPLQGVDLQPQAIVDHLIDAQAAGENNGGLWRLAAA